MNALFFATLNGNLVGLRKSLGVVVEVAPRAAMRFAHDSPNVYVGFAVNQDPP